jgi:hypothetical protein
MEGDMTTPLADLSRLVPPGEAGASWIDYEEIRQILVAYCHVVDRALAAGEIPDVSHLYHPDSSFSNSWEQGRVHVGRDAVIAWYEEFLGKRSGYYRWTRHKISEPLISIERSSAQAVTYFDADSVDRHDRLRVISGRYDDEFAKDDGKWLIKNRYVELHYHYTPGKASEFVGWG